jgi:ribosome maturation factor RimP
VIELIGTVVEVGTGEAVYEGRLVEVNEDEIYLESESGWVVVPMERVAYVRKKEGE